MPIRLLDEGNLEVVHNVQMPQKLWGIALPLIVILRTNYLRKAFYLLAKITVIERPTEDYGTD